MLLVQKRGMVVPALDFFKTRGKIQIRDQIYSLVIGYCDASKKSDFSIDFTRPLGHFLWCISEMAMVQKADGSISQKIYLVG